MKLRGGLLEVSRAKDSRYPLTAVLSKLFPSYTAQRTAPGGRPPRRELGRDSDAASGRRDARIEIVSEELCGKVYYQRWWTCSTTDMQKTM